MKFTGLKVDGDLDAIFGFSGATSLQLPLCGAPFYGGFAGLSEDWLEEYIDFNRDFVKNPDTTFYGRIKNDSMEPIIPDGSYVVYDSALEWNHGSLVVGILDGFYVAKRYWRTPYGFELRSHNPAYDTIVLTEESNFIKRGKIIAVISSYLV